MNLAINRPKNPAGSSNMHADRKRPRQQQSEGLSNQAEGKVQEKVRDLKDIVKGNR